MIVKPLVWVEETRPAMPHTFRAQSPVGWYDIEVQANPNLGWYWLTTQTTASKVLLRFDTLTAAQMAAQADFEERILSAIAPWPG